jgi:hypothetical protein
MVARRSPPPDRDDAPAPRGALERASRQEAVTVATAMPSSRAAALAAETLGDRVLDALDGASGEDVARYSGSLRSHIDDAHRQGVRFLVAALSVTAVIETGLSARTGTLELPWMTVPLGVLTILPSILGVLMLIYGQRSSVEAMARATLDVIQSFQRDGLWTNSLEYPHVPVVAIDRGDVESWSGVKFGPQLEKFVNVVRNVVGILLLAPFVLYPTVAGIRVAAAWNWPWYAVALCAPLPCMAFLHVVLALRVGLCRRRSHAKFAELSRREAQAYLAAAASLQARREARGRAATGADGTGAEGA